MDVSAWHHWVSIYVKIQDYDVKVEHVLCHLVIGIQAIIEVCVAILIQSNMSNILKLNDQLGLSSPILFLMGLVKAHLGSFFSILLFVFLSFLQIHIGPCPHTTCNGCVTRALRPHVAPE